MTAESGHGLLMMLKEHAEEWQRQIGAYEQLKSNSSDVFEDAVNIAARTMKRAVAPPLAGPAADFMGGMLSYHEYMPMSLEPTNIDFERLVAKAKSDFSAYLVLRLAALMAVDDGNLPALKRAKQELALEIFPAPRRPRGRSPYANVSRHPDRIRDREASHGWGCTCPEQGNSIARQRLRCHRSRLGAQRVPHAHLRGSREDLDESVGSEAARGSGPCLLSGPRDRATPDA